MIAMAARGAGRTGSRRSCRTTATAGEGIAELAAALDAHWSWLEQSGEPTAAARPGPGRRSRRSRWPRCAQRMGGLPGDPRIDGLAARVAAGELDPYSAADELVAAASVG